MTKYEVEVCRTSYVIYTISAEDEDEAQEKALRRAESRYGKNAEYTVESTEELL